MAPPSSDSLAFERRPRGPKPFIVQMLRAPLTLTNIIALTVTHSVYRHGSFNTKPLASARCANHVKSAFGVLAIIFALSLAQNLLAVVRFHRIRRQVFGESMCAARRRWRHRRRQGLPIDDEEIRARGEKFRELVDRMPSLFISVADLIFAVGLLGMWMLTTLIAKREGKVELGVAYSSIGALVAGLLNLIVGMNGVKMWARKQKRDKEARMVQYQDMTEKEALLEH